MSEDVVSTSKETSVGGALRTMAEHDVRKLPVVAEFELVGIVTTTDVAQHRPESVREMRDAVARKDDCTD